MEGRRTGVVLTKQQIAGTAFDVLGLRASCKTFVIATQHFAHLHGSCQNLAKIFEAELQNTCRLTVNQQVCK